MMKRNIVKLTAALALVAVSILTGCAPVTVSSIPPGAKVYYKDKDKLIGTAPVKVNLFARDKNLVVRKDGYFSHSLVVSPVDPQNTTVELRPCDRVLIMSEPTGADLYVEGVGRVGHTPYRIDYEKPYRTFEIRAYGYAARKFTVPEDPEDHIMISLDREDLVTVDSKPKNAHIIDPNGNDLGTTPLAIPASGLSTYTIFKDGYYSKEFTFDKDTPNPLVIELERQPIVIIYSDPAGARVVNRGVTLGQTPFRQLVEEDMKLDIESDRCYTKTITIAPDSPHAVNVTLDPKPYVTIDSNPSGAKLYLSGGIELVGSTPVEVLIEKDTAFEMHLDGYDIKPFTLSQNSSTNVTVPLVSSLAANEKTILIDSEPSGAEVYRPGGAELIGTTPFEQRVRGERTYELHLTGYKTKIVTVATDSSDHVVFALARDESARNVTVSDPLLNTPSSF